MADSNRNVKNLLGMEIVSAKLTNAVSIHHFMDKVGFIKVIKIEMKNANPARRTLGKTSC